MSSYKKLPSIDHGFGKDLGKFTSDRVIIQEKVDGSQLTIFREGDILKFYNKGSVCNVKNFVFIDAYLQLKLEYFEEGLYYHGESLPNKMKKKGDCVIYRPNTCEYLRLPRYNFIVYEIVRLDGTILTPDEMSEKCLKHGLEMVKIYYDSLGSSSLSGKSYNEYISDLLEGMNEGLVESGLGLKPEGVVFKVLNRNVNERKVTTRFKFVRPEFSEMNLSKKKKLVDVLDVDYAREIGKLFDVPARRDKAIQHLKEKGKWKDDLYMNVGPMIEELDVDLLKERSDEIKDLLFIRYCSEILKSSRGDVKKHLSEYEIENKSVLD